MVKTGTKTVETVAAEIEPLEMAWVERFLNILSDPNVTYVLFLLGLYGLMFELYSPGAIFPGIIGGISLILALYAMNTLPVNYASVALIVFAVILFLLEIKIASHGMLAIGGTISMLLGSMMLIQTDQAWDVAAVSWSIIIPAVVVTALFFLFVVGVGLRAQRLQSTTGMEGMTGKTGETITPLNPKGNVLVHGEIWNATSTSGEAIEQGKKVRVVSLQNFILFVEAIQPDKLS
jgi:membrane-bound serine protease (ClpP class)